MKRLFAEITKSEELDDGTVKVWGYASSEAVDCDGETITADAMKAALPDYMKFGAVREMHQPKAAGTAIEAEVQDDGRTWFGAHVVDSEAVKKVKAGVYKGFSIGGRVTKRDEVNKSVIQGLRLVEVSLVDRPANPEAVFELVKADTDIDAVNELAELLDAGTISPQRLVELAKAALPAPASATETDAVKKGMGSVARLACLLSELRYLVQDQIAEAANEGDGSAVPAGLADWLDAGGKLLQEMVTEEVGELVADLAPSDSPVGVYLAERALALVGREVAGTAEKAGRALSAASMSQVKAIHDAAAKLGGCDGMAKHEHGDELAKAAQAHADELAKAHAEGADALAKARAEHEDALAKVSTERDALKAEVAKLKAEPTAGKALLKAIGKTDDLGTGEPTGQRVDPITKSDGTVDDVATLIKSIHSGAAR